MNPIPLINPVTGIHIPAGYKFWVHVHNIDANATWLALRYVIIKPDGTAAINERYWNDVYGKDFNSTGAETQLELEAPQGELINLEVTYGNANVKYGRTFIRVDLATQPNAKVLLNILEGFVYAGHTLSYPISRKDIYDEGDCVITTLHPANPAAGLGYSTLVNANKSYKIIKVTCKWTLAAGALKSPFVSTSNYIQVLSHATISPPAVINQTFDLLGNNNYIANSGDVVTGGLPDIWIPAGTAIYIDCQNKTATDQLSDIYITFLERVRI